MIVAVVAATPPTLAVITAYYKGQKKTVTASSDILTGLERIEQWAKHHEETDRSFENYVHLRFHDILNQLAVLRSFHNVENVVSEWRALRSVEGTAGDMPGQGDREQFQHDEYEHSDHGGSSNTEGIDA